ncbi:MAG: hypothetical protein HGA39_01205 [Coriobacteriia bacterium]|nr:hypothetical protein [Coriobacteriia bacterium]
MNSFVSAGTRRSVVVRLGLIAATLALGILAFGTTKAFAATFNPLYIISDENWRAGYSMSQAEIQAFLETQNGVLKSYSCAEGGPNGLHSQVIKPASQIIAEAAGYWNVNPKLIIATLQKEQSLITQPFHTASASDPYGTDYHLTNAMGCGVYEGSPDRHPGFGDQVWTGAQTLGCTTGSYKWQPGQQKLVWSYPDGAYILITPVNQPTWNFYTYTPYYPQQSVWNQYMLFFGDPLASPALKPVYRFYNKTNGSHFYTGSELERYTVMNTMSATYTFEGPAYSVNASNTANSVPLYRFYNVKNGSHFYTASAQERDTVIANWSSTYRFEGPAYNVSMTSTGGSPVYRFYNKKNGSHFYTVSLQEANNTILNYSATYNFEGIAYYIGL